MPPTITATLTLETPLPVSLGDEITFNVELDHHVNNPRIEVAAYQDGQAVYIEAGGIDDAFLLGGNVDHGSIWRTTGGPADCLARLYYFKNGNPVTAVYLADTAFAAS